MGSRLEGSASQRILAGFWEKSGAMLWPRDKKGEGYGTLLRRQPWTMLFCFSFVFASGFGQTFFLSLFQLRWQSDLGLSTGQMGSLYGAATLLSGLLLPFGGRWLDQVHPKTAAIAILCGLSLFALLTAGVINVWMLGFCLFGLRFFGQGMSSSLGITYAARWFDKNRGRAVGISGLGYPLSEAVMPISATVALALIGWRWSWVVSAILIAVVGIPVALISLRNRYGKSGTDDSEADEDSDSLAESGGKPPSPIWQDWRFYLMLGVIAPIPFVGTGVIFFQGTLAESRGWSMAVFPAGFFLFALVRAFFSLSAGAWVDRLGSLRLIGLPGLMFALAICFLLHPSTLMVIPFFIFMGIAFGTSGSVMTPAFTEIFGISRIGAVRGSSVSVAVFVTAAAPAIFGWILQLGATPEHLLTGSIILLLTLSWGCSLVIRHFLLRKT